VATLLSFLLSPVVDGLHRWGLRRQLAVILVVIAVFSLLGSIGYALGRQVSDLAAELPAYRGNILRKISAFRTSSRSKALARLERTFRDIVGELQRPDATNEDRRVEDNSRVAESKPVPVVVQGDRTPGNLLPVAVGSAMEMLVTALMVIVLVIFMLLRLQDLRNRVMRLVGYSRLTTTTKALDDAGARISRYLLMQSIINATYGFCVGLGLYFIGLPYIVLLGFIAGTMRFIPYLGPPMGAVLPIVLSFGLFNGWMNSLLVIALFVGLELATSMVLEPLLYGQSAGVSEVALLIAIAFWTWLWGPVGLALATPLTVCLVVLCKYIPELEFIEVLLGDESVVEAPLVYYQRLLARDTEEAADTVRKFITEHSPDAVYDHLFVPALHWAKRDLGRDKLQTNDQRFILQSTRDLLEDLGDQRLAARVDPEQRTDNSEAPRPRIRVLGWPVRDKADELCLQMLGQLLDSARFDFAILSSEKLYSEMIDAVRAASPDALCIVQLSPDPVAPVRRLCKRLRDCFPQERLLACLCGHDAGAEHEAQLLAAGADFASTALLQMRDHLLGLFPVLSQNTREPDSKAVSAPAGRQPASTAA
jgi:predicted PurR-regulated permease PerM